MKAIKTVLDHAEKQCIKSGTRLTEKRRQLLGQLLASGKAMSAYELADNFAKKFEEKISPMSVYRILDILRKANLVHKLNLSKKYIAAADSGIFKATEIYYFPFHNLCRKHKILQLPNPKL